MCDGCPRFVAQAEQQLSGARRGVRGRMGRFMTASLQSFVPNACAYNLVWVQWCVGYLTEYARRRRARRRPPSPSLAVRARPLLPPAS